MDQDLHNETLFTQVAIDHAIHWALSLSNGFVITTGEMQLVPKFLEAANVSRNVHPT